LVETVQSKELEIIDPWMCGSTEHLDNLQNNTPVSTQSEISIYNISLQYQCTVASVFDLDSTVELPEFQ